VTENETDDIPRVCLLCDERVVVDGTDWCPDCCARYPYPLLKATLDHWQYFAMLTTGETVSFQEADIAGDWVTLKGAKFLPRYADQLKEQLLLGRGIVVRVDQIVWVVDEDS